MSAFGRGRADYLALGDWNAVCYECGRKRKASTMKRHWQGYYVCPEHWEPRQPQDFVRSVPDVITPPWTQPVPATYTFAPGCSPCGQSAVPGFMQPGCAYPNYLSPMCDPYDPGVPVGPTCTPNGSSAVPGQAVPVCMVPGYISPFYNNFLP